MWCMNVFFAYSGLVNDYLDKTYSEKGIVFKWTELQIYVCVL